MSRLKSAATRTIKRAGAMTPAGRRSVARWLRKSATQLERRGEQYAPQFTAHYVYR